MLNLAVFVSGGGSNFGAVLDGIDRGEIDAEIKVVIASKPDIYAIERAKERNIPSFVFQMCDYGSQEERFEEIDKVLKRYGADFIALLGSLMILPPSFVKKYEKRMINIHPSLIPNHCGHGFYGLRVHRSVLAAGDRISGATVHYVDEGTDTGEIILQREVPVLDGDTPETLAARVLETEHKIIVEALSRLSKGQEKGEGR